MIFYVQILHLNCISYQRVNILLNQSKSCHTSEQIIIFGIVRNFILKLFAFWPLPLQLHFSNCISLAICLPENSKALKIREIPTIGKSF